MFPEYAMALDGDDAIITGDGEDAFLEIVQRFDKGEDFLGILGLWWKDSTGTVVKNEAVLQQRYDAIPMARSTKNQLCRILFA